MTDWVGRSRKREAGRPFGLVPNLRDCARGYNNRAQMCAQLSAIDVTEKTFFERLYKF